ncbi:MAG: lectin like domain-containing protein [Eubacteriales bacterium]|nr:lectin like domain-containing protein [Eubacteriales bacterium]
MKNNIMKHAKRAVCSMVFVAAMGIQMPVQAAQNYPVCDNWIEPAPIEVEDTNSVLTRQGAYYPAKYDARNVNGVPMVTSVKNQGSGNNTCWAFAIVAAMENNLILNGYADSSVDLSENQFAYFFYNRKTDPVGFTKGDKNLTAFAWNKNGGSLTGAGYALMTWAGVTTEKVSPYLSTPASKLCYRHEYSAKNMITFPYSVSDLANSVERIKEGVLKYGAVATGMRFETSYMSLFGSTKGAYYYNGRDVGNHAVTIVGWDDNYSRNNFTAKAKPTKNGAWIVKNSYGPNVGDNGYLYISYEDKSIKEMVAVEAIPASEQYQNNYQHDGTANPLQSIGFPGGTTAANVFQARANGDYCEQLKAVSVCTLSTNVSYEVQIYTGLTSQDKPTSGTKVFSTPVKGKLAQAGYYTITLPKEIALVPGEYFSVVIKLKNSGKAYIALDTTQDVKWINFEANVAKNQSFIYYNKKWYDMSKMKDPNTGGSMPCNVRIKAYTNNTTTKPSIKLLSSVGVSKGSTETLSLKKKPANIYRAVTWKGNNNLIATVASDGKVTGKQYGEMVVSATYMKNEKKVTLKCNVTVGPEKVKNFNAGSKNGKLTINWSPVADAGGYEVCYATKKDGTYERLAVVKNGKTTMAKKLNSGAYYVKMRAYKKIGKKTLYGSFTTAKKVTVQQYEDNSSESTVQN